MSSAMRAGYKQTEAGLIPEDWDSPLLDSIAKRGSGHTPDKQHPEYWNGNIKWISLKDSDVLDQLFIEETAASITPAGVANSSAVVHAAGTVVLSRDAGVGKSAIMKTDMAVSQHFMAWQCGTKLYNIFLYYWLQAKKPEFERIAMGNTIKTIGLPYFRALKIPIPLLPEQRAIATALSDVDALLAKLDALVAKKRDLKVAAMQQLLTGQTRLPGFSGEWEVKRLGDLADFLKGAGLSKGVCDSSGSRKCILYGELFTTYKQVIREVVGRTNSHDGRLSEVGDVLVPGSTTTEGIDLATASAVYEDGVALGGDINIIRCKRQNDFDATFLANYLTQVKKNEIAERAQGSTIVHLYGRDLADLLVQHPSYAEQIAIATVLSDMDTELTALESRRDKTRALKQGMMQELLTGRIRLV
jgi:type I restriction enzyme S subunit